MRESLTSPEAPIHQGLIHCRTELGEFNVAVYRRQDGLYIVGGGSPTWDDYLNDEPLESVAECLAWCREEFLSAEPVVDETADAAPATKRWTVEPGRFLSFDGQRRFRLDLENLTAGEPRYCRPFEGDDMAHVLCMLLNRSLTTFPVPEQWAQEARLDGGVK